MPGGSTTTKQENKDVRTSGTSQVDPWAPAVPFAQGLLGQVGGINTAVTPQQSDAVSGLMSSAQGLQDFGPAANAGASRLLSGGNANQFAPLYSSAYSTLQNQLSPYASGERLDPYGNPALRTALDTTRSDITNQIGSQFASAGRDLSPAYVQALSRGIEQGVAPTLANQFNQNVSNQFGAANQLYGAGTGTAGALAGLNQTELGNIQAGLGAASQAQNLAMAPAQAQFAAANAAQNLPWGNLSPALQAAQWFAGLGRTTSGTQNEVTQGNVTQQQQQPLGPTLLGGAMGGLGLLGNLFNPTSGMFPGAFGLYGAK